ncbi:TAT-variant-translocated molybdopterin oxidoreductase [Eisenibacter elegans]|uniref:TAT-variant-translocated molybdopterin oxidoreductase n=1 Tax=Eisenibacter elegans TaxID=997 RepID=UPI000414685F|nr:TAT-variant-translocated molybdopterin oxidoreductase [Eisenibacter elegans]
MEHKKYWKGIEELTNDTEFVKNAANEFPEFLPIKEQSNNPENNSRRDFLKLLGFSVAAASLAACDAPVKYAIPYLNKPEDVDPSVPNFYASTFFDGSSYASILVKTREGRPIKIEGNKLSSVTMGGTSARTQASVLGLYDDARYKTFLEGGSAVEAKDADAKIVAALAKANAIRIVSPTIISPATKAVIADFIEKYPAATHVMYDTQSAAGIRKANETSFGKAVVPSYQFQKAEVIVSFGADFLGTWISPAEFARQYAQTRRVNNDKKKMSRHYQFETRLSLSGANADYRGVMKPSQSGLAVLALYEKLTGKGTKFANERTDALLTKAAKDLNAAKGKALVVSSSNDPAVQTVVNAINDYLGNYGNTIDLNTPLLVRQGDDAAMSTFVNDAKAGKIDAVIFYGANPVYDYPEGEALKAAIAKMPLSVSLATQLDETSEACKFVCPDHHYLESWNDAEPKQGFYSLAQPTIQPLFKTRQAQESLLTWAGNKTDFYAYLTKFWQKNIFSKQDKIGSAQEFWNISLHDGIFETTAKAAAKAEDKAEGDEPKAGAKIAFAGDMAAVAAAIRQNYKADGQGIEIELYEKTSIGNGAMANNPWLQEMPDSISKATWDNYVAMPQSMANEMGIKQGDVVKVTPKGKVGLELPVLVQPGQAQGTVSVALGYGRSKAGKVAEGVGQNVAPWISIQQGMFSWTAAEVSIEKVGKKSPIAQTQTHNTIMARHIVREANLSDYQGDFEKYLKKYEIKIATSEGDKKPTEISLWKGHKYPNHSWGMTIDLNSCFGCGACTIACQVENNIPVVGKKEVLTSREMHWLRIDRYYSSDAEVEDLKGLEQASENPQVIFQPMMCQHCNNAPCETVCPVLATTHSSEGLNQMAYNRCIGTRYCANNCPYKVRRFNWFHYAADDRFTAANYPQTSDLGKMVLNPDVTVRSRGVMEKCTMCVQRIQAGKLEAKKQKRALVDGDVSTACAEACPTQAITFGDMNDKESAISKLLAIKAEVKEADHGHAAETTYKITEPRAFHVLEEINVRPQVTYLTKIRNLDKEDLNKGQKA